TGGTDTAPGARAMHEIQGDWSTRANQAKAPVGALVEFECPRGGTGGNVWGTDVYTDDSSICEAAVHAGMIVRADGGIVRFELLGAQPSFQASERHGVRSIDYPTWPGSFRFVAIEE
ncbi:MAG TPA: LCCL domain-containing protein, partial [Gemmatimonadota bacterium]|nr:LCCL domain-containing protein [Gemmatimonadota bacterium]